MPPFDSSTPLQIIVAAPGRAGGALAIAAEHAGHRIVGVISRNGAFSDRFEQLSYDTRLPAADLLVIATRDDHIEPTAARLAPFSEEVGATVHLSGFKSIAALEPFGRLGIGIGSFHPLQSLPDPETGARSLTGAWAGVTAAGPLFGRLEDLATSLGMIPFPLPDSAKPVYHAAAAAASNFVTAALDLAEFLLGAVSVPFAAVEPLTRTALANAFTEGPQRALTGPIARHDWDTLRGQLEALKAVDLIRTRQFRLMAEATAITAATSLPEDLHE